MNGPFLCVPRGNPAEYRTGLKLAIDRSWLWLHESGTYASSHKSGRITAIARVVRSDSIKPLAMN
jgi:hypothetical protein